MTSDADTSKGVASACRRTLRDEWRAVSVGMGVVLVVMTRLFRLWELRPRVPIVNWGDAVFAMGTLRNVLASGWYSTSDLVGVPYGQDLRDHHVGDPLHMAVSWLLVNLTGEPALTLNLFFFGSYFTVFLGAYAGSRMLDIGQWSAVSVGVLYTFLPFHVVHGPSHLLLSSYGAVPLFVALAVRQMGDRPLVDSLPGIRSWRTWLGWVRQPAHLAAIVIVLLGATTGIYYAVFMVATLLFSGIVAGLAHADRRRTSVALAMSLGTGTVVGAQFVPIWWFQRQVGSNSWIVQRGLHDIEYFSLRLSDLVLPVNGHRFQVLADLQNESRELWPLGEHAEAIGLVGLVGLVLLVVVASARLVRGLAGGRHGAMALIAGAVFALGTVGGGATVLGVFGLTYLRAWGRISVVVAFCAFAAVGIGLDRVRSRLRGSSALFVVALVVTIGVLDTNPRFPFVPYDHMANAWASEKAFVHRVEDLLGEDAEIFQLPIVPFPENPPVYRMSDYDHLLAYLHSDTLGWSYGGVKGRASDWQQRLVGLSADELAEAVAGVGFDGLWLDRFGYGGELAEIETLLGLPALEGDNGRFAVYDLRPVRAALVEDLGSDVVERDAAVLIEPVTVGLGEGFYGLELGAGRRFTWAPERAEIRLRNPTTDTRSVLFSFVAASAVEGQWVLDVEGLPAISRFPLTTDGTFVDLAIEVPSGGLSLNLRTDAPRLETTDPREIRFRILDPLIEPTFD